MDTQQRSTRDIALPIVLIGPVNAGKSTIGQLLAQRLSAGRASLDELCWPYFEEAGEEFVRHPANRSLATLVVYTAGKTPEETCDWILTCLQ